MVCSERLQTMGKMQMIWTGLRKRLFPESRKNRSEGFFSEWSMFYASCLGNICGASVFYGQCTHQPPLSCLQVFQRLSDVEEESSCSRKLAKNLASLSTWQTVLWWLLGGPRDHGRKVWRSAGAGALKKLKALCSFCYVVVLDVSKRSGHVGLEPLDYYG